MNPNTETATNQGIVYKKTIGGYSVQNHHHTVECVLSTRLRKQFDRHTDPIAVGDHVQFTLTSTDGGVIDIVFPRINQLSRRTAVPMPDSHAFEQVLVANVDQVVPVFAVANPPPKWNMLDRYLVSAESAGIPSIICITKTDLMQADNSNQEILEFVNEYRRIGYEVVMVSSLTGAGLSELQALLSKRVSVLVGKSGVGKTSLLNALEPGLGLKVNQVNQTTGKGRHTTTNMQMFPLPFGGAIVDTPGVREFGLWEIEDDDLAHFFPEMRPFIGRCRFGLNCRHHEEPGCAIRKAVMDGVIHPRRYQSFERLRAEI